MYTEKLMEFFYSLRDLYFSLHCASGLDLLYPVIRNPLHFNFAMNHRQSSHTWGFFHLEKTHRQT